MSYQDFANLWSQYHLPIITFSVSTAIAVALLILIKKDDAK